LAWWTIRGFDHQHIAHQMLIIKDLQDDIFENIWLALFADEEVEKDGIEQRDGEI